jgi:hypothetical protein
MDKVNELFFLHSSVVQMRPNHAFGCNCSNRDVHIQDQRVARLLVLLQQLDKAAAGLGALPNPELTEIVSSATRLCGFVDPLEALDVIAAVLGALKQDVISTLLDAVAVQYPDPESESP